MVQENKCAIVTGGAKGIGRDISLALANAGFNLVLVARDEKALGAVADQVRKLGRRALPIVADVTRPDQVEEMSSLSMKEFGNRVDVLVNVAGVPGPIETPVQNVDPEAFDEVMRINVGGTFLPIKFVTPIMIAQGFGKIINIGSNSGTAGYPNRVGYAASKWAVRGLTKTIALELGQHNINVNCINPGIVDGPRMQRLCRERAIARDVTKDDIRDEYIEAQAIKRVTSTHDVANAVLFLASDAAQNITGQDIDVDGGWGI